MSAAAAKEERDRAGLQRRRGGKVTRPRRRDRRTSQWRSAGPLDLAAGPLWALWVYNPLPDVEGAGLERLEWDLQDRLAECDLRAEDKERIHRCIEELEALGPQWTLLLFGSVANGFGLRTSDIDVTCLRREGATAAKEEAEVQEPEAILRECWQPVLSEHPRFAVTEEVLNAKVPILKVQYDTCLDIDLSCQNVQAVQNTKLLRAYAGMHPRVRELGIAVKLWAKAAQVCGACRGHLSSYTFTLLTIYYLQVSDAALPCLPTSAFEWGGDGEDDARVQKLRAEWVCPKSTAELLANFFLFYTFSFAWGHEVASIRTGGRHLAVEQRYERLRGRWALRLHVEDPFLLDRNLHCVLGDAEEMQLRAELVAAVHTLHLGHTPRGLLPAQPRGATRGRRGSKDHWRAADLAEAPSGGAAGDAAAEVGIEAPCRAASGDAEAGPPPAQGAEAEEGLACKGREGAPCAGGSAGACAGGCTGGGTLCNASGCADSCADGCADGCAGGCADGCAGCASTEASEGIGGSSSAVSTASGGGGRGGSCDEDEEDSGEDGRGFSSNDEQPSSEAATEGAAEAAEAAAPEVPWWRCMGSAIVAQQLCRAAPCCLEAQAAPKQPGPALPGVVPQLRGDAANVLTVQDLERMIGQKLGCPPGPRPELRTAGDHAGRGFAARSTSDIAARVNRLCLAAMQPAG